jgi:hypothetical protein
MVSIANIFPFVCVFFADGLTDCQDSDCCISVECKDHILCAVSADPLEILLRKQPPTITASFYERMKFLVEDSSVQSGATLSSFNDRFGSLQPPFVNCNRLLIN